MTKYRKILSIVLLENEHKQIHLQLRDNIPNISHPNYWGIFGGGIEAGEDRLSAALREIQEELLIVCDPEKISFLHSFELDNALFHLFHYPVSKNEMSGAKIQEGQRMGTFSKEQISTGELEGHLIIPHHLDMLHWYWKNKK